MGPEELVSNAEASQASVFLETSIRLEPQGTRQPLQKWASWPGETRISWLDLHGDFWLSSFVWGSESPFGVSVSGRVRLGRCLARAGPSDRDLLNRSSATPLAGARPHVSRPVQESGRGTEPIGACFNDEVWIGESDSKRQGSGAGPNMEKRDDSPAKIFFSERVKGIQGRDPGLSWAPWGESQQPRDPLPSVTASLTFDLWAQSHFSITVACSRAPGKRVRWDLM
ncbi:hypothetical protein AAFF_G00053270 [Aldrovandia affinis]|uniref:Uncharacterized protein n=1 Tax=Aldrovandia affinis TaxID=143900 RepID=A0AAD7T614_9TELE|nr:hypothetical protein AAFF_G00053270 [Aldrovandia affinis]